MSKPETRRISASTLRDVLEYKPEIGAFVGRLDRQRKGSIDKKTGGWVITIQQVKYRANRLAWLYMTGEHSNLDIEFIDNNPLNLKWNNLREATSSERACNSKISSKNTTGIKGLSFSVKRDRWVATIEKDGKQKSATFRPELKEDAIAWLQTTREKLHGDFANNGDNKTKRISKQKEGYFYERNTWTNDIDKPSKLNLEPKQKVVHIPEEHLGIMLLKELAKLAI
jgi:hypothetical protein